MATAKKTTTKSKTKAPSQAKSAVSNEAATQAVGGVEQIPETPLPPSQQVHTNSDQKKTMMVLVFGVLLILGIGSLIGFAIVGNSPEGRLATALQNLRDANSLSAELEIVAESDGTPLTLELDSSVNFETNELSASGSVDLFITRVSLDARFVDDNYYVKLEGLAGLEAFAESFLLGFTEGFTGGAPVDDASLAQIESLSDALLIVITDLDGEWIEIQGSVAREAGLDLEKLMSDFRDNYDKVENIEDVLTINEVFGDKTIGGKTTVHMELSLDPSASQSALTDLLSGLSVAGETFTREEVEDGLEDIFDEFDPDEDTLEAWIDKDTNQLVQVRIEAEDSSSDTDATLTLKLSDYNAVAPLELPEDPLTLLELTGLFTRLFEDIGLDGFDANSILDTGDQQL